MAKLYNLLEGKNQVFIICYHLLVANKLSLLQILIQQNYFHCILCSEPSHLRPQVESLGQSSFGGNARCCV